MDQFRRNALTIFGVETVVALRHIASENAGIRKIGNPDPPLLAVFSAVLFVVLV